MNIKVLTKAVLLVLFSTVIGTANTLTIYQAEAESLLVRCDSIIYQLDSLTNQISNLEFGILESFYEPKQLTKLKSDSKNLLRDAANFRLELNTAFRQMRKKLTKTGQFLTFQPLLIDLELSSMSTYSSIQQLHFEINIKDNQVITNRAQLLTYFGLGIGLFGILIAVLGVIPKKQNTGLSKDAAEQKVVTSDMKGVKPNMNDQTGNQNFDNKHLELAKMNWGQFNKRRDFQWKVNFSLWSIIGVIIGFFATTGNPIDENISGTVLRIVTHIFILSLYIYWRIGLEYSNAQERALAKYHMKNVVNVKESEIDNYKEKPRFLKHWSPSAEIATTSLLVFISYLVTEN